MTASVETMDGGSRERVYRTLTLGFAADPVARHVWPNAADYLSHFPRFAAAFGGRGFDHGTAYATPDASAAALWLPPEVEPDGAAIEALIVETVAPEKLADVAQMFEAMEEYHPAEKCWYLPMIGADPAHMGKGLGAALMKHALARCDAEGLPAYLESSNPRNISLYERHGFEVIGEIRAGAVPVMTPMYRAARPRERRPDY